MIDQQPFGRTGHLSTRTIFGAAALAKVTQDEADTTLELVLSYGVNHVDTAASYGDSEDRLGDWIRRHGQPFFLATKTGERTAQAAREQFQRSLDRLHVDHVDLLQLHNLVDPKEWETAFGPGGALEAALEARAQGLTRFIGVTGHGRASPGTHRQSLARFDFDSVLLPLNYVEMQDANYRADWSALLALCDSRHVAVQTIKSIVRAPWGDRTRARATWYEPLEDQDEIDRAVHWVLGHPGIFLNTVADIHVLPRVLNAASRFQKAPDPEEMQSQVDRLHLVSLFAA